MAVNFKLSDVKSIDPNDDPMNRDWVGYNPALTDQAVFDQNRGMWYLGARAGQERYATFSYAATIVVIAEIDGVDTLPWPNPGKRRDKQAVAGRTLKPGDDAYEHFIGRDVDRARNPVSYIEDPDPAAPRFCACGCGAAVFGTKHFVTGHDQKALHERIASQWGDTLAFIQWFDATYR